MMDHPAKLKHTASRNKGSAVADVWIKKHPGLERKNNARATLYDGPLSKESKNCLKNQLNALRAERVLSKQGQAS